MGKPDGGQRWPINERDEFRESIARLKRCEELETAVPAVEAHLFIARGFKLPGKRLCEGYLEAARQKYPFSGKRKSG